MIISIVLTRKNLLHLEAEDQLVVAIAEVAGADFKSVTMASTGVVALILAKLRAMFTATVGSIFLLPRTM